MGVEVMHESSNIASAKECHDDAMMINVMVVTDLRTAR